MNRVQVHERIHNRHPEISIADVVYAWENFSWAAIRSPGEEELRIGFDLRARELEMVGVALTDGWLIFHAMTPPSKKTRNEVRNALRSLR